MRVELRPRRLAAHTSCALDRATTQSLFSTLWSDILVGYYTAAVRNTQSLYRELMPSARTEILYREPMPRACTVSLYGDPVREWNRRDHRCSSAVRECAEFPNGERLSVLV